MFWSEVVNLGIWSVAIEVVNSNDFVGSELFWNRGSGRLNLLSRGLLQLRLLAHARTTPVLLLGVELTVVSRVDVHFHVALLHEGRFAVSFRLSGSSAEPIDDTRANELILLGSRLEVFESGHDQALCVLLLHDSLSQNNTVVSDKHII